MPAEGGHSEMSIMHCKNEWSPASMLLPSRAASSHSSRSLYRQNVVCRPIVSVGDRHDVVQDVSNAVGEVTICHKVRSPLVAVQTRLYPLQCYVRKNFIEQSYTRSRLKVRERCRLRVFRQKCEQCPSPAPRGLAM